MFVSSDDIHESVIVVRKFNEVDNEHGQEKERGFVSGWFSFNACDV